MSNPLIIAAIFFLLLCLFFLFAFIASLKKKKFFGAVRNITFALLMLTVSLLCGVISFSLHGYNALTKEELAASVEIIPLGEQAFTAILRLPDGTEKEYNLRGDEFYIDAHILKWKAPANLIGLHTFYELDRVSGRYTNIDDEINKTRTIYSAAESKQIDIFKLRLEYPFLSFLVDAEYGSASFLSVKENKKMDVMVSTTGLLIRGVKH